VAMLFNAQWPYAAVNSERLLHPAFEASVVLRNRIVTRCATFRVIG
jgi:hypothetical protein